MLGKIRERINFSDMNRVDALEIVGSGGGFLK
jgi:hypothetical protein